MLKRDITYEDFNGNTVTETFYFNMTKTEVIELEVSYEGGLEGILKKIIETEDRKGLIEEFKKIVLLSYGMKSPDGKRFIKNDELREEFSQSAAFDVLFIELATDDDAAAIFVKGILPGDLSKEVAKAEVVELPKDPPAVPLPPQ